MDKCININNGKVKEIAAKLGVIPAIAAIKMEIWMENNGGKIPSAEDLISEPSTQYSEKQLNVISNFYNEVKNLNSNITDENSNILYNLLEDSFKNELLSQGISKDNFKEKLIEQINKSETSTWFNKLVQFLLNIYNKNNVNALLQSIKNKKIDDYFTEKGNLIIYGITKNQNKNIPIINKILYKGVTPIGYDVKKIIKQIPYNILYGKSYDRYKEIIRTKNLKESEIPSLEQYNKREDAWRLSNGLPQLHNTFKYIGKNEKNEDVYDFVKPVFTEKSLNKKLGTDKGNAVMGNFAIKVGKDKIGQYIEYSDRWDLEVSNKTIQKIIDKTQTPFVVTGKVYKALTYDENYEPIIYYTHDYKNKDIVVFNNTYFDIEDQDLSLYNKSFNKSIKENIQNVLKNIKVGSNATINGVQKFYLNNTSSFLNKKQTLELNKKLAIQELKKYGLENNVEFEQTTNSIIVNIKELNIKDEIEYQKNKNSAVIKEVIDFLTEKFNVKVKFITREKAKEILKSNYKNDINSFFNGDTAYLIKSTVTEDIAIEEILHPFINTLESQNPTLYNSLLEEAKKLYPKLRLQIDSEYKTNQDKELVTQALSRTFRKEYAENESKTWEKLVNSFVKWLKNIFKSIATDYNGTFEISIENLPKMTLKELAEIINTSDTRFSQLDFSNKDIFMNKSLQQNAVNKLTSLQGKQSQFDTYYTVEGFETKLGRASAAAKKNIQDKEEYKTEEEVKQQEKFMASGTFLHDIMSEIVRREFPEENKHRTPMDITPDMSSYYTTMEKFMAPIIKEAKDNGDVLLTEIFVANLKSEKGGTIDLLAVTPEGNYRIYDLKNRYKGDKTNLARYNKIGEFSRQLEIYKNILEDGDEKLGIPKGKVSSTLVLENKVSYNDSKGVITKINGINVVAPDFLMTTDDKINSLIVKLTAQVEMLATKIKEGKNPFEKETNNKLLKSKMELLQGLQLKQDVNSLIEHAEQELAYIEMYLKNETDLDTTNIISELDLYIDLVSFVDTNTLTPEMDTRLGLLQYKATKIKNAFLERQKDIVVAVAGEMDVTGNAKLVDNLFAPIKDEKAIRKFTTGIGEVDNALVQTAFRVYNNTVEKVAEKMDVLKEKFLGVLSRYEKVVGSKNFDILLNNKKTALVTEFSSEFWDEFKKNRKAYNLEWAKENLDYDKEAYEKALVDFEAYQNAYKEVQMKRLEVIQSNKGFKGDELAKEVYNMYWAIREKDKKEWLAKNKNNPYAYFKAKSKWVDPKWREIKQGKYKGTAVEEFYDFYTNYMKLADEIAPEKIRPGFIANFSQDFLEKVSNLGMIGAIKGGYSELLNSLELKYDEALYGKVNPTTGEQIRKNFIPGLSSAKQAKSTDLGKSFLMFMEGVFRYEEISKIESTMSNIKYQLRNVNEQRLDSKGNPVVGGVTTVVNPTKGVSEKLEYMIDALIYGAKQKDEGSFELKGNGFTSLIGILGKGEVKTIAYAKLVDKMIRYTGLRNLAFNVFSPPVNILGGTANMYMSGAGGLDYSAGDLTKAIGLITAGKFKFQTLEGQKMRLILEWLRLDKDKIDREVFRKVTNNVPSAILDKYNGMTGMRESESVMVESGAAAMLLSGKHSIKFEDFDVVDGKLVFKKEFNSIAKSTFKQKIMAVNSKTIGAMNPDDVMLAKKYMLGRMLMQHRSWLPAQAFARFGGRQFNYALERYTEGRYRVAVRAFKSIMAKGVSKGMESLTPEEEAAAKEAFAEATIILGTMLLLVALHAVDDDDKKEAWYKMTNKVSTRVLGELFFFADPTLQSQWAILQSPAASTSTIEDAGRLVRDIFREASADFQEDPEKVRKKAKPGEKAIKMIPYLSKTKSFLDDLYNEEDKK